MAQHDREVTRCEEEGISAAACDLSMPPGPPGSTKREDFLKYSSPLSLDPNTVNGELILSENNMKVSYTVEDQRYPDHPERFTSYPQVLSSKDLSGRRYFEVEWTGWWNVEVAVSYKDIDREEAFGLNDKSWSLVYSNSNKRYWFTHDSIDTEVTGPVVSLGGSRWGVYVDHGAGVLCFYNVRGNDMALLHTERTTFTRPLYAGICVSGTAEVCKIW